MVSSETWEAPAAKILLDNSSCLRLHGGSACVCVDVCVILT